MCDSGLTALYVILVVTVLSYVILVLTVLLHVILALTVLLHVILVLTVLYGGVTGDDGVPGIHQHGNVQGCQGASNLNPKP